MRFSWGLGSFWTWIERSLGFGWFSGWVWKKKKTVCAADSVGFFSFSLSFGLEDGCIWSWSEEMVRNGIYICIFVFLGGLFSFFFQMCGDDFVHMSMCCCKYRERVSDGEVVGWQRPECKMLQPINTSPSAATGGLGYYKPAWPVIQASNICLASNLLWHL